MNFILIGNNINCLHDKNFIDDIEHYYDTESTYHGSTRQKKLNDKNKFHIMKSKFRNNNYNVDVNQYDII